MKRVYVYWHIDEKTDGQSHRTLFRKKYDAIIGIDRNYN